MNYITAERRTMNELQIFNSEEFGDIRTVTIENEPMFCLSDVCKALGLTQPSKVKDRLNEKGVNTIPNRKWFDSILWHSVKFNSVSFRRTGSDKL